MRMFFALFSSLYLLCGSLQYANTSQCRNLPHRGSLPRTPSPTPPPDLESYIEEDRLIEQQARKYLEDDGCPPCYPTDAGFSLQDPPAQYKDIISYWEFFSVPDGGPLCAQKNDWRRFRKLQEDNRRHYQSGLKTFADFEDAVLKRQRRHRLEDDISLNPEPRKQSRLENWIEFRDCHLQIHDRYEKEIQAERDNLTAARCNLKDANASNAHHAAECVEGFQVRLARAESKLKMHDIMQRWIEQWRKKLAAEESTAGDHTARHNTHIDTIRRTLPTKRRKRKPKARSVLSSLHSGVSKRSLGKRTLRRKKADARQGAGNVPAKSDFHHNDMLQMPNPQANKHSRAKQSSLHRPFRPQKVMNTTKRDLKTRQTTGTIAYSRPLSKSRKIRHRKPTERTQFTLWNAAQQSPQKVLKTKSGRRSSVPERPGFVSDW